MFPVSPTVLHRYILVFRIAGFAQAPVKGRQADALIRLRRPDAEPSDYGYLLLCKSPRRCCERRQAQEQHQLAPSYAMRSRPPLVFTTVAVRTERLSSSKASALQRPQHTATDAVAQASRLGRRPGQAQPGSGVEMIPHPAPVLPWSRCSSRAEAQTTNSTPPGAPRYLASHEYLWLALDREVH